MTNVDLSGKEEEYVRDLVLWFLNTNKRRHAIFRIILSLVPPHTIQRRHNLHIYGFYNNQGFIYWGGGGGGGGGERTSCCSTGGRTSTSGCRTVPCSIESAAHVDTYVV